MHTAFPWTFNRIDMKLYKNNNWLIFTIFLLGVFLLKQFVIPLILLMLFIHLRKIQKIPFSIFSINFLFHCYFITATLVYLIKIKDYSTYTLVVLGPYLLFNYFSLHKEQISFKYLKILFLLILGYSILMLFRDSSGNFTLNLSKNHFLLNREIDLEQRGYFFVHATIMSLWLTTAFVFSLVIYSHEKTKKNLVFIFLTIGLLLLANTRSSLIIVLIIFLFNFFIFNKVGRKKTAIIIGTTLIGVFILYSTYGSFFDSQLSRIQQVSKSDEQFGLGFRVILYWLPAIDLINNDWFGYGHKYFFDYYKRSVHNEYLGNLMGIGIIPFVFYYLFLFRRIGNQFKIIIKKANNNNVNEIAFYMLLVYFLVSFVEQVSISNVSWIYLMIIFISIAENKHVKNTR